MLACLALYALIALRGFRVARRAVDDYAMFLALGLTLNIVLEALLIAGGSTGLVPLTGVVLPFVSYGRSALVLHLLGLGMLWSLSARVVEPRSVTMGSTLHAAFDRPRRMLLAVLAFPLMGVLLKTADVQVARANATFARESLEPGRFVDLRYEDLLADPAGQMEQVHQALDVPFADAEARRAREHVRVPTGPEKWRTATPGEIERVLPAIEPMLERTGYRT